MPPPPPETYSRFVNEAMSGPPLRTALPGLGDLWGGASWGATIGGITTGTWSGIAAGAGMGAASAAFLVVIKRLDAAFKELIEGTKKVTFEFANLRPAIAVEALRWQMHSFQIQRAWAETVEKEVAQRGKAMREAEKRRTEIDILWYESTRLFRDIGFKISETGSDIAGGAKLFVAKLFATLQGINVDEIKKRIKESVTTGLKPAESFPVGKPREPWEPFPREEKGSPPILGSEGGEVAGAATLGAAAGMSVGGPIGAVVLGSIAAVGAAATQVAEANERLKKEEAARDRSAQIRAQAKTRLRGRQAYEELEKERALDKVTRELLKGAGREKPTTQPTTQPSVSIHLEVNNNEQLAQAFSTAWGKVEQVARANEAEARLLSLLAQEVGTYS